MAGRLKRKKGELRGALAVLPFILLFLLSHLLGYPTFGPLWGWVGMLVAQLATATYLYYRYRRLIASVTEGRS